MPEMFPQKRSTKLEDAAQFIKRFGRRINQVSEAQKTDSGWTETDDWIDILAQKLNARKLGVGSERSTYILPDNKLLGVYRAWADLTIPEQKSRYYSLRMLHALFPDNFPRMYAAGMTTKIPKSLQPATKLIRFFKPGWAFFFDIKQAVGGITNKRMLSEIAHLRQSDDESRRQEGEQLSKELGLLVDGLRAIPEFFKTLGLNLYLDLDTSNVIGGTYIDSDVKIRNADLQPLDADTVTRAVQALRSAYSTETATENGGRFSFEKRQIHIAESCLRRLVQLSK